MIRSGRTGATRVAAAKRSADAIDLERAVEVFVRGFAFTRSFTHPYLVRRTGPLWALRDGPRANAADYRREEYVALGVAPEEADGIVRGETRGRFAVCVIRAIDEPDAPLRAAWKGLGYRLHNTEPLMAHRLGRVPRLPEPLAVRRVLTQGPADALAKAARSRQVLPEHLTADAPLRQYVATDGERVVGWVRSIEVGDATWVSNMYVRPDYRRRGIGRSMLAKMLRDDREHGAKLSVLAASHTGALLYPHVGYELIGELLVFTPTRT